jgi:hypothetical protein
LRQGLSEQTDPMGSNGAVGELGTDGTVQSGKLVPVVVPKIVVGVKVVVDVVTRMNSQNCP